MISVRWMPWVRPLRKLIVTKLPYKGQEFLVAALEEEKKITEIRMWPETSQEILDNIYLAQVDRVQSFMNCAFVMIDKETSCYMELLEAGLAYQPNQKENKPLKSMSQLVVQVTREAGRKKNPRVTALFSLHSAHMVLARGNEETGISRKLPQAERERLRTLVQTFERPKDTQLIIRTNAAGVPEHALTAEYARLLERYRHILHMADTRPVFSILEKAESGYVAMLKEYAKNGIVLRTDSKDIVDEIHNTADICCTENERAKKPKAVGIVSESDPANSGEKTDRLKNAGSPSAEKIQISLYEDALLPLYKLYRLETVLDEACSEKVWLKSGGFLVIQQTDAFVAVDVNSGKYSSKKQPQEIYKKINLEAADALVRQLRLRNLSGMILVDFINMKNREDQEELLAHLRTLAASDPIETVVIDMTPLGIVEITRKKTRKPLAEQVGIL